MRTRVRTMHVRYLTHACEYAAAKVTRHVEKISQRSRVAQKLAFKIFQPTALFAILSFSARKTRAVRFYT